MGWSGLKELPLFWQPFQSFWFAVAMGIAIPALLALVLGYFTFRNRIRGVYFTILTQALVIITTTLLIGQQAFTGGTNGITGYSNGAWLLDRLSGYEASAVLHYGRCAHCVYSCFAAL